MTASPSAALLLVAALAAAPSVAEPYRRPADELVRLAEAPLPPRVFAGPDDGAILLADVPPLLPIAELAQPELKLAGLRFNPANESQTRTAYLAALRLVDTRTAEARPVSGLPAEGRVRDIAWSPDGARVAFALSLPSRVELWVAERQTGAARRVSELALNAAFPAPPCRWLSDSRALACRVVPADRGPAPKRDPVPAGPLTEENLGVKTPAPTFQDLLHDEHDAALFEYHLNSEAWLIGLDGATKRLEDASLIVDLEPSPDASLFLVSTLRRPFSYHLPASFFPLRTEVIGNDGSARALIADLPLADELPIDRDAVRTGRRDIGWRGDAPATLFWVEARDGGDPRKSAAVRDELFQQAAPFAGAPDKLASLALRFNRIQWGSDRLAVVRERFWKTREEKQWLLKPGEKISAPRLILKRSYEDRYSDPGELVERISPRGTPLIWTDGARAMRFSRGASPEGDRPFADAVELETGKATRLWRSEAPFYEEPLALFADGKTALTRRESQTEPPDFFARELAAGSLRPLTHTQHPYPALRGVRRELIHYKRADGLELSATLYLPPGYDGTARLPVLLWAYPQEFKAGRAASQVRDSPHRFPFLSWGSPLFFLARGYAVVDNPSFPIIGEGSAEPNDTYVEQLVADARAVIDDVVARGVGDRDRFAIGGHSYGAFMTANLLAHSRLFRAGIARSGAYNRTLTPFGFQSEERSFWEATKTYVEMSPFTHASSIDDALLLIHGMDDNNSGTFPVQSERLFAALKGLGKTVRLVLLPDESHGYRARESVLHMLFEMDTWLDHYLKHAPPQAAGRAEKAR